jgi:predicted MFS family arabinose efflux permease
VTRHERDIPSRATGNRDVLVAALGGLIGLAVGIGVGRFVYTPILPAMVAELGLSKLSAGLIASANFVGYLAGALLASHSGLPGTRRSWLLAGLAGSAATTAAMGFAHTLPAFVALRFLGGAASAFVLVFATALLLDFVASRGRPGLSAVLFAGVGIGIAASAVLVSLLIAAGQDWSMLWLASGLVSALGAFAAARMIPAEDATLPLTPSGRGFAVAIDRRLVCLTLAYGLFGFGYIITATFLVAFVRENPDVRALEPVVWVIFGLAAAPSVALWNGVARRFGLARAFALAALVEAAGIVASVVWPTAMGVLVASVGVGGTFMGLTALGLMRGRELARGDPRQVLALMTSAFGLGQILGPSFAGLMLDYMGDFAVASLTAAAALVVAAVLALL